MSFQFSAVRKIANTELGIPVTVTTYVVKTPHFRKVSLISKVDVRRCRDKFHLATKLNPF